MDEKMSERHGSHLSGSEGPPVPDAFATLATAAMDRKAVTGWTHNFYRYPARFSPKFAAAAIQTFSKPGDMVVDPYMGGATSVVEALAARRSVIGNDLNSLAAFIAKVKITWLLPSDVQAIRAWVKDEVPAFSYWRSSDELGHFIDKIKTKNLSLVRARFIKKAVAAALMSIAELPSREARDFAKCAVLRVSQWALDGRACHTPLREFRENLAETTADMLAAIKGFAERVRGSGAGATILNVNASELDQQPVFQGGKKADLIITSPPYPGVHVLYHRWQVDGRRETPAPYWIAGCSDGQGASFYNFGDRRQSAADNYFRASLDTLKSIRCVIRDGGTMVQMVAFNRPDEQLPRYLANMEEAGFAEAGPDGRIWRQVPNRKWHACLNGKTHSSNEVVLIHRAV